MVTIDLAGRFKSSGSYPVADLVNLRVREYPGVDRADVLNEVGSSADLVWHFCLKVQSPGRTTAPDRRRGRAMATCARGAKQITCHDPLH